MGALVAFLVIISYPAAIVAAIVLAAKLYASRKQLERFRPIANAEDHLRRVQAELGQATSAAAHANAQAGVTMSHAYAQANATVANANAQAASTIESANARAATTLEEAGEQARVALANARKEAAAAVAEGHSERDRILRDAADLDNWLRLHEVGHFAPPYDFGEAVEYKQRIEENEALQAQMLKARRAAICESEWTIGGSRAEGRKVTGQILKLMLRAFNGECDALVAKVRYDNVAAFAEKLRRSWETINKLGAGFTCLITREYLDLKMDELALVHEYQERLQAEKEEQRALREQMRDEERAQREIEKAQRDAEQEEARFEKALNRARQEAQQAVGAKQAKLLEQIAELEERVREAEERRQRAISMAQLTKAGHVYVLSNIGSFGEQVYKIGMTRRLDPQDRVDELGDASVPFPFDVHAMIRTDDAPSLERALHSLFEEHRMNKINRRKEFFRVTLEQIEQVVRNHHGEFKLTRHAEAIEFRKSLPQASNASGMDQERRDWSMPGARPSQAPASRSVSTP